MIRLVEPIQAVPYEFWYAATIILAAILVWVIKDFVSWLRKAVTELKEGVGKLTNMVEMHGEDIKRHNERLNEHDDDIDFLKGKPKRRRQ